MIRCIITDIEEIAWATYMPMNVYDSQNKQQNIFAYINNRVRSHANNANIHVTSTEKADWNAKLDSFTELDPTIPAWAKAFNKPAYTASEVGAVPISGTTMTGALIAQNNSNYSVLGSEYYLTDASTIAGNASMPSTSGGTETEHIGNGYARITAIKVDSLNLPVNIGGTWKDANEAFVNIGGTWKTVEAAFVNIGGTWKELG